MMKPIAYVVAPNATGPSESMSQFCNARNGHMLIHCLTQGPVP